MLRLVLGKIKSGSEKMFVHVNKYDRPVLRCSPFLLHAFVQTGEQHRIVDLRSPAFWRSLTRLAGVDAGERVFVENVVLRFVLVDPECEQFPTGCKVFNGWNVCWGQ